MSTNETYKTPVGILRFGSLFEKDKYDRFSAGVEFDKNDPAIKQIGELLADMQRSFVTLKKGLKPMPFYRPAKDIDGNPQEGKILLTFKSGFPVTVSDSMGKKLPAVSVGAGSKVRIAFKPVPQEAKGEAYIALYLSAVQIIDLVEYDPNPFANDHYENGYVAPQATAPAADVPFDDAIGF